jgi:MFS-type transporter involved in bile tolerance (Atg22 family)
MGCGLLVFAASRWFELAMAAMLVVGFSVFRQLAASNTMIQGRIDDEYRGRIMALYSMMAVGTLPVGHLLAGVAAKLAGARWTVAAGGAVCLAAASLWAVEMRRGAES